jgi:PleD family two-component response regulator
VVVQAALARAVVRAGREPAHAVFLAVLVQHDDDQAIVAEAIRRMLAEHPDVQFQHRSDVTLALTMARKVGPTGILQDLVMPDAERDPPAIAC